MAVKMRKWSPWPPAASAPTRKFQVAVKPLRLEGLHQDGGSDDHEMTHKFVAIKVKWKGEPKLFPLMAPFQSRQKKEILAEKIQERGRGIVQWDEDRWFENICCFSVVSNHRDPKFGSYEIAFTVLHGEKMDLTAKMAAIGRVFVNISEIACSLENSSVERKLPMSLQIDGCTRDAILTVLFNFVELRETQGLMPVHQGSLTTHSQGSSDSKNIKNVKARRRSLSHDEEESLDKSDELGTFEAKGAASKSVRVPALSGIALDSDKKDGWFSWKSKSFSFKRAKNKEGKLDSKAGSYIHEDKIDVNPHCPASSVELFSNPASQQDDPAEACSVSEHQQNTGVWEEKELISRDGQAKLKAPVFFASFDQCSDEAGGESACTTLVAVMSHWLQSNSNTMPSRSEFDNLIMQGSSEWRRLCEDAVYAKDFPNRHFDLETVMRADIRPISIAPNKSFVGFFGAESFESLKGVMSFDDMWNVISMANIASEDSEPWIYIVSWNDHFFVLKVEANAYYIIDTLGERLFEGCNQAFILRFDDKALLQKHDVKDESNNEASGSKNWEDEEVICSGKECCREFIKRFLAAIPLKELEEEEKKKAVSYFSLHQRLQIEFNYSCLSSTPSSLTSSPLSSLTATSSSPLLSE